MSIHSTQLLLHSFLQQQFVIGKFSQRACGRFLKTLCAIYSFRRGMSSKSVYLKCFARTQKYISSVENVSRLFSFPTISDLSGSERGGMKYSDRHFL